MKTQLTALHFALFLLGLALGASTATAQTELFFATGVDSTGRAVAQSNADGHVLIESPQYPRDLWLHLVDKAGDALAGIQVEYQGRPDSLVAIRCIDPTGGVQETLIWTRPEGDPLRLTLKPSDATDLPAGVTPIDWQIGPIAEALLELKEETRLEGWEAVAAFLWKRWHDRTGRVAVRLDASTLAFELEQPEDIKTLVDHLQQTYRPAGISLEERPALYVQVFRGGFASLREGVILYLPLFADANLERVVRQALGRPQARLTSEDVASLTELSALNKDIHSLAGLEHFTALKSLTLVLNRITEIGPLADLNNLESLNLRNNQITEIGPLADLNNLESLNLESNQITEIGPLADLNNLESLNLRNNRITEIGPLAGLTNLESLNLRSNQITDMSPLASLTNLESLTLRNNRITEIGPLAGLTNLESLTLRNNRITEIGPLADLNNLRGLLDLGINQITDISPLADLNNLERLNLGSNQITDISPLADLNNLESLNLSSNQITEIGPLADLNNLESLDLRDNPLSAQTHNEHIPTLQARGVTVTY